MKKLTTLTLILFTSCMNGALAKGIHFTCREAIPDTERSYSASFVSGGIILQVEAEELPSKKVNVVVGHYHDLENFKARVQFPKANTQGFLGGLARPIKNFELSFAVLPNYKETNTQSEYLGGLLYFKGAERLMLCDVEMRDLFDARE